MDPNQPPSPPPPVPPPNPVAPAAPPPPVAKPPAGANWWQQNWKWFVPTGCLTLFAIGVAFVGCIVVLAFGVMRSSDAYKIALARAKGDARVREAIGTPIGEGLFISGSTHVSGDSGKSDITIPIHGPKGTAKIYVVATKSEGEWEFSKLIVKVEKTGERINLAEDENK
jgi:hypothetical protein